MKAAEAVLFPAATAFLPLIKELRFRNLELVNQELQYFPG